MAATAYVAGGSEPITIHPRWKREKSWPAEMTIAEDVADAFGAEVVVSSAAHQVAKIVGADFKVVLYPHRTTARNYHLRVRDEGSKNLVKASAVMDALDRAAGSNCTFSRKLR